MMSDPLDGIDPECPEVKAFETEFTATSEPVEGEKDAMVFVDRVNAFAVEHRRTCPRCQGFVKPDGVPSGDNRSSIWGGATLGLLVGLIVGFFRDDYWQTVLFAVGIGVALGLGAEVLGRVGTFIARRK